MRRFDQKLKPLLEDGIKIMIYAGGWSRGWATEGAKGFRVGWGGVGWSRAGPGGGVRAPRWGWVC
jgi:hypothetical protein